MTAKITLKPKKVLGPVDYVVVLFPGNKFTGKIAPELVKLEKNGIIRVIDMVFVQKDKKGKLTIFEAKNLGGSASDAFSEFAKNVNEWFSMGDIEAIAESLPENCSAGILLFENTWAVPFKEALINADAVLVDHMRIPADAINRAQQILDSQGGA